MGKAPRRGVTAPRPTLGKTDAAPKRNVRRRGLEYEARQATLLRN